jgi:hypothetical protein
MKVRSFLSALLSITISFAGYSQTVYHLEYNFKNANDSNQYDAIFIRYNNGSGIVKIKYLPPGSTDSQLVEMKIKEQYFSTKHGTIDTTRLLYKATDADFLNKNPQTSFTSPVFWATKDPENNFFEPSAVSATDTDTTKYRAQYFKAEYIKNENLPRKFVSRFFGEQEDFYQALFKPRSRGGNEILKKINIYLLVVANTNDTVIGVSCYKDMKRVVSTFQDIAEFLQYNIYPNINIYPTTIYGRLYNKKYIDSTIKALKPSEDDIVIFYYTGHGFRKANDNRTYPYLDFRAKPGDNYNVQSMNLEDIYQAIRKKGAKFNLVLSDCCNNFPGSTNSKGTPIPESRGNGIEWNVDNCVALFQNTKRMSVIATAADVSQLATSNNNFGGFFSYFFKTSMEDHLALNKPVTWSDILKEAKTQTIEKANNTICIEPAPGKDYGPENLCKQSPHYDIKYETTIRN